MNGLNRLQKKNINKSKYSKLLHWVFAQMCDSDNKWQLCRRENTRLGLQTLGPGEMDSGVVPHVHWSLVNTQQHTLNFIVSKNYMRVTIHHIF